MIFPTSSLAAILPILSLTLANPIAAPEPADFGLETRQSGGTFRISKFQAHCAQGKCQYQFQIDADGTDAIPYGFTASCLGVDVPRGDTTLRNCSVNRGEKIQQVQAYLEQRPLRPNTRSLLMIDVGVNDGGGRVSYYRAEKSGTYGDWQAYSSAQGGGRFDLSSEKYAGVA